MLDSYGADLLGAFEMLIGIQPLAPIEARCAAAPEIVPGQVVEGTTAGEGLFEGRCGNGALGPEDVWILVLDERTSVDATLNSVDFDGVLHVRGRCTDPATETVCNDDHGGEQSSRITTELDAGTWFFFVDGRNKEDQGSYEFDITTGP